MKHMYKYVFANNKPLSKGNSVDETITSYIG